MYYDIATGYATRLFVYREDFYAGVGCASEVVHSCVYSTLLQSTARRKANCAYKSKLSKTFIYFNPFDLTLLWKDVNRIVEHISGGCRAVGHSHGTEYSQNKSVF
jgi:hypothetical protein